MQGRARRGQHDGRGRAGAPTRPTTGGRALLPRRLAIAVIAAACLAVAACTTASTAGSAGPAAPGSMAPGPTGTTPATTSSPGTTALPPEVFTGSDADFYVPPDPLPPAPPGTLIRTMPVADAEGVVNVKVMYHSRDALDRDRAVTALVTYPTATAPVGGWPIVATAPGTVGIDAHCGVTHSIAAAPSWGVQGVRVITDYIGLGVVGGPPHPYFSRLSEGHSVIDAARAARNLSDAHASSRWVSVGHSQGGHGALSASELAATYAPELELVATLALAPGAMLSKVYGGIDPVVTAVLTAMSLYGGAGEHPEIKVEDYITPELAAAAGVLKTGCLDQIANTLAPLALEGKLFKTDPRTVEPTRSFVAQNEVGDTVVAAPLFLVSGTADDRVVIDRVRDLYARLCAAGQVTQVLIVDGADHGSIIPATADRTAAWLNARLAGEPVATSCGDPGALTPTR